MNIKKIQVLCLLLLFLTIWNDPLQVYAQDADEDGEEDDEDEEDDDDDDENFTGEQYYFLSLQRASPYFGSQTEGWEADSTADQLNTTCGGKGYLGGPDILEETGQFETTFYSLPEHNAVSIVVTVGLIGNWKDGDKLAVKVGEENTAEIEFSGSAITGSDSCTIGSATLYPFTLKVESQNEDEEELVISISKVSALGQFAIRDFKLTVIEETEMDNSISACFMTTTNSIWKESSNVCGCESTKYKDSTGACKSCHASCGSCKGPKSTDCLSCPVGFSYDGSECFKCDSSCETCSGPGPDECTSCHDGKFFHSDLTCQDTCEFKVEDYFGDLYCDLCTEENTYELDSDNEDEDLTLYYFPDDQMCKTICPEPYASRKMGTSNICFIPLSKATVGEIRNGSDTSSSSADAMTGGLAGVGAIESSNPATASSGKLARMFEYVRYIDVSRSPNLEVFFKAKRSVPGTVVIGPKMANSTKNTFKYTKIPAVFARYNLHSNFLVNFWDSLATLLLLVAIVMFLYGLELAAVKYLNKFSKYFHLITLAVFGFLVGQYYSVYSDIVFFCTIDFRSLVTGSAISWVSFFIGIILLSFSIAIVLLHGRLLRRYQRVKIYKDKESPEEKKKFEEFQKDTESVQMLYKDYRDATFFTQAYFMLLTIRNFLFGLIMGVFFAHPILQVSLLIALNVLTILYLSTKKPFINIFSVFQQIVFEIVLLLTNICFLIMAILDATHSNSKKQRKILGEVVMWAIFSTKFIPLITIVPMVVMLLMKLYKDHKAKKLAAAAKAANAEPETAALISPHPVPTPDQQQGNLEDGDQKPLERKPSHVDNEEKKTTSNLNNEVEATPLVSPQPNVTSDKQENIANTNLNNNETANKSESYQECEFSEECGDNSIHIMQMELPKQMWQGARK